MKLDRRESLKDVDYENCYQEALQILREKYDSVGMPYCQNGERMCDVETLKADDLTVFMLAWGSDVAHQIAGGDPLTIDKGFHKNPKTQNRSAAHMH